MKVKIIEKSQSEDLQNSINEFLTSKYNLVSELIDIKLSSTSNGNVFRYIALIIYK